MSSYWVDVDNPPQAQYLSPIARELRDRGHEVLLTSRDHAPTLEVLKNRGEEALPIVGQFGTSKASKVAGTLWRGAVLAWLVRRRLGRPSAVVSTSRSGVLAARALGSPPVTILDYEGVELGAFIKSGTTLLHPEVVPAACFTDRGFPEARLFSFPGLKEDIAFSGIDLTESVVVRLPSPRDESRLGVLVRPPSQTSHYRVDRSMKVLEKLLDNLATQDRLQVIFSPREQSQIELLDSRHWHITPVVLEDAIPMVSLLRQVDYVITGGGTMLREAAWFGVPGSTLFQGQMPAVDEWLENQGAIDRLTIESDMNIFPRMDFDAERKPVEHHPEALEHVIKRIVQIGAGEI